MKPLTNKIALLVAAITDASRGVFGAVLAVVGAAEGSDDRAASADPGVGQCGAGGGDDEET